MLIRVKAIEEETKQNTDLNPDDAANERLLISLFIGQSSEDIRKKLQNVEGVIGKNVEEILELAMKVFFDKRDET